MKLKFTNEWEHVNSEDGSIKILEAHYDIYEDDYCEISICVLNFRLTIEWNHKRK